METHEMNTNDVFDGLLEAIRVGLRRGLGAEPAPARKLNGTLLGQLLVLVRADAGQTATGYARRLGVADVAPEPGGKVEP